MPLPQPASLRDRTPEFLAIAERLQRQPGFSPASTSGTASNGTGPGGQASTSGNKTAHGSEFARRAADIGHGIHRTSLKLQKLAQLAKRTSAFDDPAQEVDDLTGVIKQDIQGLNNAIADLQRLSTRGRGDDRSNKQVADHSHTVVDNLRSRLKDTTATFRDVLTARTDSLKHHRERRQLFTSNTDPEAVLPLLARQRTATTSTSPAPAPAMPLSPAPAVGSSIASTAAATPSFLAASPATQMAQQQQQMQMLAPQDTYLSSRAEALRNVENTIVELGTIFNKLSELVAEQGELAIRIDENVEDTLSNVNAAQAQLLKYLNGLQSNRWLVLKVLGVLLVFLVLFVMFIA
ncbi:Qa-SNARE, Sed5/Syntaxin5-family [Volvox carteri f. nagariensis]|uniref:Qa-SNARE, Sed5/Syntaxin5-family n=1 Tax=Volvox carteri f. nagariensis TaxID=3068 RepID=D8U0X5_VOLCA|nr:Qa-SNARE, Sed5/Syntaxin5-family [Volvox carteri f. nagariensis]EFJ46714.1 Qa-SNARE, Sed5/Syntaxin5-family [Volvox carteri f. nagariensis]|eukprot:XP_002952243.1 Qa-SNARE, Sed5/Syntaxin5-family [Volvox carteri f. nagariensis]